MFDIDELVGECVRAIADPQPRLAIKEVLERAMTRPDAVAAALPGERAEVIPLHASPELSILKVVWAPGMSVRPHNHLMWAAIGLYGGQEDNAFYRRDGGTITRSGGREILPGDVVLLGDDTIHGVTNPLPRYTGAIHVYGGDLTTVSGRSEWEEGTLDEVPYDFDRTRQYFDEANAAAG